MQKSNNLTKKKFWRESWRKINLPAKYLNNSYARSLIAKLVGNYVSNNHRYFLEIGGCPGRWAHYFNHKFDMVCDSMDYDESNVHLTRKNYEMLDIKGEAFLGDITAFNEEKLERYDIVLSDGLIEHFSDSSEIFKNHLKFLKKDGILVIGVPNIKKSIFYNFFAKFDKDSYDGYRHVSKEELRKYARDNDLKILYCDYIGVFNIGLVHSHKINFILMKFMIFCSLISDFILKTLCIQKETRVFSPAIYLIAKK